MGCPFVIKRYLFLLKKYEYKTPFNQVKKYSLLNAIKLTDFFLYFYNAKLVRYISHNSVYLSQESRVYNIFLQFYNNFDFTLLIPDFAQIQLYDRKDEVFFSESFQKKLFRWIGSVEICVHLKHF